MCCGNQQKLQYLWQSWNTFLKTPVLNSTSLSAGKAQTSTVQAGTSHMVWKRNPWCCFHSLYYSIDLYFKVPRKKILYKSITVGLDETSIVQLVLAPGKGWKWGDAAPRPLYLGSPELSVIMRAVKFLTFSTVPTALCSQLTGSPSRKEIFHVLISHWRSSHQTRIKHCMLPKAFMFLSWFPIFPVNLPYSFCLCFKPSRLPSLY